LSFLVSSFIEYAKLGILFREVSPPSSTRQEVISL
jgi:hypothetical protein